MRSGTVVVCVLAAAGCKGGGSGPATGGGGGNGGMTGSSGPRALCAGPSGPTFPDSFGTGCGAGSNFPLCAITSADQCPQASCLWDAANSDAYCTVACDPGQPASCPAGYGCRVQQCSSGPPEVCVRTGPPPGQECMAISTAAGDLFYDYAASADGHLYALGQTPGGDHVVFHRGPGQTAWTQIHQRPPLAFGGGPGRAHITTPDAVYYMLGDGKLLRMAGATVNEETYETCTPPCDRTYLTFFRTPAGGLRAFTQVDGEIIQRNAQGGWDAVVTTLPRRVALLARFQDSGFVGACQALGAAYGDPYDQVCTATTGDDPTIITLPSGEELPEFAEAVYGSSPSDFLIFFASGALYHRSGGSWVKEGLPPRPAADTTSAGVLTSSPTAPSTPAGARTCSG